MRFGQIEMSSLNAMLTSAVLRHALLLAILWQLAHSTTYFHKEATRTELFKELYRDLTGQNKEQWMSQPDEVCDDCDKTTTQLIQENGYHAEEHTVTTSDGYLLTVHRIPRRDTTGSDSENSPNCPVLLQHGLLGSSADWVMLPAHRSLAYMLSDYGYDVWLGNNRGNTYSRSHVNISVHDPAFWEFSWDEMGRYDMPAVIDYILNSTQKKQICYIGHSMGTTTFWALMHHRSEYNSRVLVMNALAPIAKVSHMRSVIRLIAPIANDFERLSEWFGLNDFLPNNSWIELMAKYVCGKSTPTRYLCYNLIFLLAGSDSKQMNATALPVILSHTPAGTSTRTVVHYAQEVNRDAFQHFDWGASQNVARYGQTTPPDYQLSRVQCPILLYTADNDILADQKDVEWLTDQLTHTLNSTYRVPYKNFNHVDFLWATDADQLLYKVLIANLNKFQPN